VCLSDPGQADGVSPVQQDSHACQRRSTVQPLLSSSYQGWGTASLDQDADELLLLLRYLRAARSSEVTRAQ